MHAFKLAIKSLFTKKPKNTSKEPPDYRLWKLPDEPGYPKTAKNDDMIDKMLTFTIREEQDWLLERAIEEERDQPKTTPKRETTGISGYPLLIHDSATGTDYGCTMRYFIDKYNVIYVDNVEFEPPKSGLAVNLDTSNIVGKQANLTGLDEANEYHDEPNKQQNIETSALVNEVAPADGLKELRQDLENRLNSQAKEIEEIKDRLSAHDRAIGNLTTLIGKKLSAVYNYLDTLKRRGE